MNYYEIQDLYKQMFPNKSIKFELDDKCQGIHTLHYTNGRPNDMHHVEYNKLKVTVENMEAIYVPMQPHVENITWEDMKKLINSK